MFSNLYNTITNLIPNNPLNRLSISISISDSPASDTILSPEGNVIPPSNQTFVLDSHPNETVLLLSNQVITSTTGTPMGMSAASTNNILANMYTEPFKNDDKEKQIIKKICQVSLEYFPKLSIQTIINNHKLIQPELELENRNDKKIIQNTEQSQQPQQNETIESIKSIDEKDQKNDNSTTTITTNPMSQIVYNTLLNKYIQLLNKNTNLFNLPVYINESLNTQINEYHQQEFKQLINNKIIKYNMPLSPAQNKDVDLNPGLSPGLDLTLDLDIQIIDTIKETRQEFINQQIQLHGKFQNQFLWRKYVPELKIEYQAYIIPFGYLGLDFKIVDDQHTYDYHKNKKCILKSEIFYEVYYDLTRLRILIIDNNNIKHLDIANYQILYWYYDPLDMQFVFGNYEFKFEDKKYKFYLKNNSASTSKKTYIQFYEIDEFEDFLFYILPLYAKQLVKDKMLVIV